MRGGALGEADEGWVRKGTSGGQGTRPCLCRSLPFPLGVLRKLCGLAAIKLQLCGVWSLGRDGAGLAALQGGTPRAQQGPWILPPPAKHKAVLDQICHTRYHNGEDISFAVS